MFFILCLIISMILFISKIENSNIITVIYILFTIFMILTYFKNKKISYLRYLYILWVLVSILTFIFFFNVKNIISIVICTILVVVNYLSEKNKVKKDQVIKKDIVEIPKKIEVKKEKIHLPNNIAEDDFENEIKQLYIDMQKYFSSLEYDNLKKILSDELYSQFKNQMLHLEKSNKRAIRDILKIYDFKINDYDTKKNCVNVSISVIENKYTKYLDNTTLSKSMIYDSCYEIELLKKDRWIINNLKLLCSHSKRID